MHAYVHIYDNQTNVKLHSWFPPFVSFRSFPPSGFFLLTMFAKDLTGCFSHCCVEDGDHWIHVCVCIIHNAERCKLPAYYSLEGFQHIGMFQLFEVKLESCVLACWFSSDEGGRSLSPGRGHFQCLLLNNVVFCLYSLLIGSASSLECNQCFVMTKSVHQHKIIKGGKLQKSESSNIYIVIAEGFTNALPVFTSILALFRIPVSLHNENFLLCCLINNIL